MMTVDNQTANAKLEAKYLHAQEFTAHFTPNSSTTGAPNQDGNAEKKASKRETNGDTISARIARDLKRWGYELWLSDLDDDIFNGDARLDDPARATLRMTARDAGYAESRLLSALDDAVLAIAATNRRHPLRDYLGALVWDGNDHISRLASYFTDVHAPVAYSDGTQRTVFHAFLLRWLICSVAKIHGDSNAARSNFVLVLAQGQNTGKSHFARWLCPIDGYFEERRVNPDDKDYSLARARTWVWEIGELGATTRRADVEALKAFLTTAKVSERKSYGHLDTVKPAIASYVGTVNPDGAGFLVDPTGNRRFAVVELSQIDWGYDGAIDVNQLWAQALAMWRLDPNGYRFTPEEQNIQQANADAQTEADVVSDMIVRLYDIDAKRDDWRITSSALLDKLRTFGGLSRGNDRQQGKEIARSLAKMGVVGRRSHGATVYNGLSQKPGA